MPICALIALRGNASQMTVGVICIAPLPAAVNQLLSGGSCTTFGIDTQGGTSLVDELPGFMQIHADIGLSCGAHAMISTVASVSGTSHTDSRPLRGSHAGAPPGVAQGALVLVPVSIPHTTQTRQLHDSTGSARDNTG